jgi:RHS repeat-associated protein
MADDAGRGDGPGRPAEPARFSPPAVSLPKGGGAIRGIGEKFAANPVTGTGTMSVPIATSPGRSGFGPQLSLAYDSGSGNGPFGFGWSLSLPAITRKTDTGLPRYLDGHRDAEGSDVFLLAGVEDLVPVDRPDDELDGHRVRRYRPRVEGGFARIERWSRIGAPGDVHWRSVSRDNVLTIYGLDAGSRIADPLDPARIFSWLVCESRDDRGNAAVYRYKAEDGVGVEPANLHERNRGPRDDVRRTANRYLKRILYGNRTPLIDTATGRRPRFLTPAQVAGADWMFEVVLDYGDHDPLTPTPRDDELESATGARRYPWTSRPDAFSSYRMGFEVRTTRLCRRFLMFHHFPGEAGVERDCLVRSTDLAHSGDVDPTDTRLPVYTFLRAVTQRGYRRDGAGYDRRGLPPVELDYTEPEIVPTVEELDRESLENLPVGLDGGAYRWADLHGEALPGILTEQGGAWFYKRNLSPLAEPYQRPPDGREPARARFAPVETVARQPNAALGEGAQLLDLAGDGLPDLVVLDGPTPGLYEHDDGEGWQPFRPFAELPTLDLRDPNLTLVDLDGDGRADVLVTEDDALVWYPSRGEEGFGPARRVATPPDEERGPRVVLRGEGDATESIELADLSGDGLADLVRIRNGDVCYWPNLGHGRFGAKVGMDNAPWFDHPDRFDHRRIRLADVDGSGTTDILYLHDDGVRVYFNQSGNGWSRPQRLPVFPRVDDEVTVLPVDLLGNGTACLVWSSPAADGARRPMRYVNLMVRKPHLLSRTSNNLGAEVRLDYAPSSAFYLSDRRDGRPWVTRLPVPVHVVARVTTYDHVSRSRFVTRYAYHHGHFDGHEREFRGFGMVEQWDTEELGALTPTGAPPGGPGADGGEPQVPPVRIRTWFHTGVHAGRDHVSDYFAGLDGSAATGRGEYFREPGLTDAEARALLLPDTTLPAGLTPDEEREACRALKGSMLRQEVYADDAGPGADAGRERRSRVPYTVMEQSFAVRTVQARGARRHAVFLVEPRESLSFHYERDPADPRVQHTLTLEVDPYGTVLKQAGVGYGRRAQVRVVAANGQVQLVPNPGLAGLATDDRTKQRTTLVTYTENRVTNAMDTTEAYRTPVRCETVTYELTGYPATGPAGRFRATDLVEPEPGATPDSPGGLRHRFTDEVAYEAAPTAAPCRRPVERSRTVYRSDDLTTLLPLGRLEPLGLPGESYALAFTPGLLSGVLRRPRAGGTAPQPEDLLPDPAAVLAGGSGGVAGEDTGDRGGYLRSQTLKADGRFPAGDPGDDWWVPSGRSFHTTDPDDGVATEVAEARRHFFLSRRVRDPFGQDTVVDFDANDLLPTETRDAVGNRLTVDANDYRVLQPRRLSDPNRNRTEVAYDVLGLVVGTAVMGKPAPAPAEGDTLAGFAADLTQAQLDAWFDSADPHPRAAALLQGATTRIVHDLHRFRRTRQANPADPSRWEPAGSATLARETHVNAAPPPHGVRIQVGFAYSDGFGREIQRKVQAEPERTGGVAGPPRWVGSGWTVYDAKGRPVRRYEPFFSRRRLPDGTFASDHRFEYGVTAGVSPVLFYDPVGRVVATLHPNHTYEKVVFDPWQQTTYDVNDTCAPRSAQTGDPRTDPDVRGYVAGYFAGLPATPPAPVWRTWRELRAGGGLGPDEQVAAERAAAHADTPTTVHLDTLGRPFLTVARNRVTCAGHDLDGTEDAVLTRVELDVEGNRLAVVDERRLPVDHLPTGAVERRTVVRYAYDLLGNVVRQRSMEAGTRWMLADVAGRPLRAWDSRGHDLAMRYDALRRPLEQKVRGTVTGGDAASDPRTTARDVVVDRIEYGEPPATASPAERERALRLNLRTRVLRHLDTAGVVTNARLGAGGVPVEAYDFKGNALRTTRRFLADHTALPDWSATGAQAPRLQVEAFEGALRYDALNRVVQSVAPHSDLRATRHVVQPVFNEANLLERVDVWLERTAEPAGLLDPGADTPARVGVGGVEYDAKGRRLRIDYRNGASTTYRYDPDTSRLTGLTTERGAAVLQQLAYTYDPAGNVTHIRDGAQQTLFFRNRRVEPDNDYVYDALYRLLQARGREHLGQLEPPANGLRPPTPSDGLDAFHSGLNHRGDGDAMGTYVERYVYDAVGNVLALQHRGSDPAHAGWTRVFDYAEPSLLEAAGGGPSRVSNRLTSTTLNPDGANPQTDAHLHDAHGSTTRLPHLGGGAGPNLHWDFADRLRRTDLGGGGTAYYVYDASGRRVRKVWEKAGLVEERLYLGGFEVFRRHDGPIGADTATLERETLHVLDDARRVALVEIRTRDTAGTDQAPRLLIRFQLGNHLDSASLELDDQAQIVSYEEYSPYGSTTYQAVRSRTETPKRYRYTGKERDEETGLSYHEARYYAPWLARWTATDPITSAPDQSQYAAFANNPIRFTDRTGNQDDDSVPTATPARITKILYVTPEELQHRVEGYRDVDPPPRRAAEKIQAVHNVTEEHQAKVLSVVNWAITSVTREDRAQNGTLTKAQTDILQDALIKVSALRKSDIPDAGDNLIYRDADHYLAARAQEWRTQGGFQLSGLGFDPTESLKLSMSPRSQEINQRSAGPLGMNQFYESRKRAEFRAEALTGQKQADTIASSDKPPSATGATEWKLLGMIDYERYDVGNELSKSAPQLARDLPGTGERYIASAELPAYLRAEAARISAQAKAEARFTR